MEALAAPLLSLAGEHPGFSAFLFLATFGYCLPIPEELALVAVGYALRGAGLPYPAALAISLVALAISDAGYYCIARFLGPRLLGLRIVARILRSERVLSAERSFAREGPRFIFASRFLVGLRSAAVIAAGFLRLPFPRYLAASMPALAIGASAWLALGYFAGARLGPSIGSVGSWLTIISVAAGVAASAVALGRLAGRRPRAKISEA